MSSDVQTRGTRWAPQGWYLAGLAIMAFLLRLRDLSPPRFVIWTGICELTGFLLVAALVGWVPYRFPAVAARIGQASSSHAPGARSGWFAWAQACLGLVAAGVIGWILVDGAFDGLGQGTALLGLAGRLTSCPAALMLLGATIVMAWQTRAAWRAAWQYAALAAAVLFTSSIGWARLDLTADDVWFRRGTYLLISASMMTLLTGFGLARVLPNSGDWLVRVRRATPVFGALALLLAIAGLIRWLIV